jgi:membrane protein YdbS with pleckstrin-like domain
MTIRSDVSKALYWIQWSSIAVAVVLTVLTIFICHRQYMVELEEVREEYLLNIRTILRFISLDDAVVDMTRA